MEKAAFNDIFFQFTIFLSFLYPFLFDLKTRCKHDNTVSIPHGINFSIEIYWGIFLLTETFILSAHT